MILFYLFSDSFQVVLENTSLLEAHEILDKARAMTPAAEKYLMFRGDLLHAKRMDHGNNKHTFEIKVRVMKFDTPTRFDCTFKVDTTRKVLHNKLDKSEVSCTKSPQ